MDNYFKTIFMPIVLTTSLLFGCSTTTPKKEEKQVKEVQATFRIGGMQDWKSFEIKGNTLHYKHTRGPNTLEEDTRQLSHNDISQFEQKLIATRAANWSGFYNNNPRIMDGTSWSFEYKSSDIEMKSGGVNTFPSNFDELTSYISKNLLKNKSFR